MTTTRKHLEEKVQAASVLVGKELRLDSYMPGKERLYRLEVMEDDRLVIAHPHGTRLTFNSMSTYLDGFIAGASEVHSEDQQP